jgi:hypothetical protein
MAWEAVGRDVLNLGGLSCLIGPCPFSHQGVLGERIKTRKRSLVK